MDINNLHQLARHTLLELSHSEGINASGKDEIYGCVFGRDSAITILKILRAHSKSPSLDLLEIARTGLLTLVSQQGKEFNLESGEEPGKFIHEFRKEKFAHLLALEKPWYVYPDGFLRNYDSIDSTPLTLIAIYKYFEATQDVEFLHLALPAVEKGLNWIITFGDQNKDHLIEYTLPKERAHGGLVVQSWTDSIESLQREDGSFPNYPISPVEAQAFAWLAVKLWGNYYRSSHPKFARKLLGYAKNIKSEFNKRFIFDEFGYKFLAQALDGDRNQIKIVTANPLLCLWASFKNSKGEVESIIDSRLIKQLVKRAFLPDMFVPNAGVRTMSSLSPTFNSTLDSYHNGSFWPMLNGMIIEGLENFSFTKESDKLREASLQPIIHFGSPIELYITTQNGFKNYKNSTGQVGCLEQAWSAAALLDMTT